MASEILAQGVNDHHRAQTPGLAPRLLFGLGLDFGP